MIPLDRTLSILIHLQQNQEIIGNISKRVALRQRLQCKGFDWYLREVYPEKFVPIDNVQGYGKVSNAESKLCLDDLQQSRDNRLKVGVYWCHASVTHSQFFSLTKSGLLRVEEGCLSVDVSSTEQRPNTVIMHPCTEQSVRTDKWEWTTSKQLRFVRLNLCLDAASLKGSDHAYVTDCADDRPSQRWDISH